MNSRFVSLSVLIVIIALILVLPKSPGTFAGIVTAIIGLSLLIFCPVLYKFHLQKSAYMILLPAGVGFTGYGWAVIIHNIQGDSPWLLTFAGAVLILIAISGFIVSVYEQNKHAESDGITSQKLYTGGIYALVRHPQALCSLVFYTGCMFYFWSFIMALTIPLWIAGFTAYAAFEEKFELVPRYGEDYISYTGDTPGLIPNMSSLRRFLKSNN